MSFKIKNFTKKYALNLFNLRNDKQTRKFSLNKNKIKFDNHHKWLKNIKKETNKIFIILSKNEDVFIGYTRFKIFKSSSEISIAIDQNFRNMGLSKKILLESEKKIKNQRF